MPADLSRGYEDDDVDDDLRSVTFEDIREYFDLEEGEVDVICGCPPCQNFSSLRDTEPWPKGKPKDNLLRAYVEFIEEATPELVFFENVSNIMNAGDEVSTDYVDWLVRQMRSITRDSDSQRIRSRARCRQRGGLRSSAEETSNGRAVRLRCGRRGGRAPGYDSRTRSGQRRGEVGDCPRSNPPKRLERGSRTRTETGRDRRLPG